MPSSRPELIPFVINIVMDLKPASILEIGTGFGKYGFLFREYLDIWAAAADPSRLHPSRWQVRIDGIEYHKPYITALQRHIYDRIIIGDASVEIDRLGTYDLIFLGDVIEHFPKSDGQRLLQKCLAHLVRPSPQVSPAAGSASLTAGGEQNRVPGTILVTTPNYFNPQGSEYGNDREQHHCLWTSKDFSAYPGARCFLVAGRYNLAVIPAANPIASPVESSSCSS